MASALVKRLSTSRDKVKEINRPVRKTARPFSGGEGEDGLLHEDSEIGKISIIYVEGWRDRTMRTKDSS